MNPPPVVDGRALQPGFKAHFERGIGRYAKNLLREMLALTGPVGLELLVRADLPDPALDARVRRLPVPPPPGWVLRYRDEYSQMFSVGQALAASWRRGQLVHLLAHLDAPPLSLGPKTVITVHDLIAEKLAALYQAGRSSWRFRLERRLEARCLTRAARLIAVSQCTKNDLVELHGLDPGRITVIPEAADPGLTPVEDPELRAEVLGRYGLAGVGPFLLYIGGIDQRKDIHSLLEALAALTRQGLAVRLAMAGRVEKDRQFPAFLAKIEELGLARQVYLLGFVADRDLPALFSAAVGFVFPSLYEGFGLPPLEAMACGAPVVAVRAAAVPEVVGRAGLLTPPGDPRALASALEALWTRPELRLELKARGLARVREFSWRRTAQLTLALYQEVAGEAR